MILPPSDTVVSYMGKPIDQCSREYLIECIMNLGRENHRLLKDTRTGIERVRCSIGAIAVVVDDRMPPGTMKLVTDRDAIAVINLSDYEPSPLPEDGSGGNGESGLSGVFHAIGRLLSRSRATSLPSGVKE